VAADHGFVLWALWSDAPVRTALETTVTLMVSLAAVERELQQHGADDPFSRLVHQGFAACDQYRRRDRERLIEAGSAEEFLTRALSRAIERESARLESGLTFLASVSASAPFIGLFGTVWGIYHALIAIGLSGQGTLDKVAGPVGEALIMTALGLAVAIPAVLAYNAFTRANRILLSEQYHQSTGQLPI
jgi:biopolymer transport protein ExbB